MLSNNNSSKVNNALNMRRASYGVIVIRAGMFILTLFAFTNIALALNWQDKELQGTGCPESTIGEWESEILNLHNEQIINIQDNKIVIIGHPNSEEYFLRNKNSLKIGEKFIEFNINADDRKKEINLEVWPHLITTKVDYENSNHNSHNC